MTMIVSAAMVCGVRMVVSGSRLILLLRMAQGHAGRRQSAQRNGQGQQQNKNRADRA